MTKKTEVAKQEVKSPAGFDIFSVPQVDKSKQKEGVWHKIYYEDEKFYSLKIAAVGNDDFNALAKKLYQPLRDRQRDNPKYELSLEASKELLLELYSKTVLIDWDCISDNGDPVAYSSEAAKKALQRDWFFDTVQRYANEQKHYLEDAKEKDTKN